MPELPDAEVLTHRHGKYVFAGISDGNGWHMLHFGMTGSLERLDEGDDDPEHTKLGLDFDDGGKLAFTNQRTFGKIGLVGDAAEFVENSDLGPDALDEVELDVLARRTSDCPLTARRQCRPRRRAGRLRRRPSPSPRITRL